jgi:hypothetical protein
VRISALLLGLMLLAAPAFAADVDGKWAGSLETGNGPVNVAFDFKADGTTLTGTTSGPDGSSLAIKNGKIDGQNITFNVTLDLGGMPFELNYKGVVSPADIKLTIDIMGMPLEFVVKKAK